MNKIILPFLFISLLFASTNEYNGGSTAPVVLAGAIVKNIGNEINKKYPRKQCPICKGTGKYLSGDGIKMVDCGYCEPDNTQLSNQNISCNCKVCKCNNCLCITK